MKILFAKISMSIILLSLEWHRFKKIIALTHYAFFASEASTVSTLWHDIIWSCSLLLVYCVLYRFVIVFPSTLIKPTFLGLGHFDIDGEGFLHTSKNPSCAGQILPNLNQIENFIHQSLLILPNWNQIENFI